ncbi:metal-sulfur cluster assembly factor [Halopenitus persicus]|jgi:metal-sulfur cluster biosynthetic enzyme|uniref:Metal-sulfur cluster biosynthetic enzyme n=1 Tax=Halopenitus persicus TaxID=1048396 RepID=A0A1H3EY76_9EURY|nr:metal-sulfur cluster assembly factor [Halopenitus persicus]QHS17722.1 metal-sulfur cluster assembly factor [haloarchaeon 3A1-DGR]SDX82919.1 Metal-sulfur cluster biosynthetic enzyme [Halopenitus persicus]
MSCSTPTPDDSTPDDSTAPATSSDFIERRRRNATGFEAEVWDVIDEIPDPHIPVSLVEMGMIYDVDYADGHVDVEMTFPCMGCPAYDMIHNDIESCLLVYDRVDSVDVDVVWEPVWSKEMLTADVRRKMNESGISL